MVIRKLQTENAKPEAYFTFNNHELSLQINILSLFSSAGFNGLFPIGVYQQAGQK
jgi:hypothetical protein